MRIYLFLLLAVVVAGAAAGVAFGWFGATDASPKKDSPAVAATKDGELPSSDALILHHVYYTALGTVEVSGCVSVLPFRPNNGRAVVAVSPGLHAVLHDRVVSETCGMVFRDVDSCVALENQLSVNDDITTEGERGLVDITIAPRDSLTWGQVTTGDDVVVSISETAY